MNRKSKRAGIPSLLYALLANTASKRSTPVTISVCSMEGIVAQHTSGAPKNH
jgi:hypothetical protein